MRRLILSTLALALLASSGTRRLQAQDADDLKRGVARISLLNGDVSVRRGDSGDLVAAAPNAPLMAQDQVITGASSRAEIQFDAANFLRIGSNAEVNLAELENRRYMLQLAHGTSTFRVLRNSSADVDLDTPNVSVRPQRQGVYRVTVRDDGQTEISVRQGSVEVFTPRGSQWVNAGQTLVARGTSSDPEFQMTQAMGYDDWDRWNEARDQELQRTVSYRYVSPDVYGAEDLDPYGQWVSEPSYGYVWYPTVATGWAPYRYGRWSWLDWYGWTWVSSDPWGWAPYHYGRWFYGSRGWCWYPGGMRERHYWSPALVAFFGYGHGGGVGVGFGWGNVGWVPLAPREHFSPWWGRNYYGGYRNSVVVDRSVYINNNVNIANVYRNARVNNGVTVVNSGDFSHGRFNNFSSGDASALRSAALVRGQMPAAPGDAHLRYADRQVSQQTASLAARSQNINFYSRRQPDQIQRVPFSDQRQSLSRSSVVPVPERSSFAGGRGNGAAAPQIASPGVSTAQDNGSRGWRRFGDPAANPSGRSSFGQQPVAPAQQSNSDGRGWRRSSEPAQSAPSVQRDSGSSNGSWRRFGESGSSSGRGYAQPSQPQQQQAPSRSMESAPRSNGGGNSGWNRFGDPGSRGGQSGSRYERPQQQAQPERQAPQRNYSPQQQQRQESIRIAPPVVRERSSGGGGGGYSAPRSNGGGGGSYSAPRMERSGGGGGGGGHAGRSDNGGGRGGRGR